MIVFKILYSGVPARGSLQPAAALHRPAGPGQRRLAAGDQGRAGPGRAHQVGGAFS